MGFFVVNSRDEKLNYCKYTLGITGQRKKYINYIHIKGTPSLIYRHKYKYEVQVSWTNDEW